MKRCTAMAKGRVPFSVAGSENVAPSSHARG
jgi:hypothetical protein